MEWLDTIWAWLLTPLGIFVAIVAAWNWPWHL
jgi:hypothetical protein